MSPSAVESFVREVVDRPQRFLDVEKKPSGVADHALKAAQELFEQAVKHQPRALGPLNALLVDGFDGDQIWEELQLRNAPVLSLVRGAVDNPNTLAALPDVTVEEEEDDEDVTMESDEEQEGSDLEEDDIEDDDEDLEEGDEDEEDEEEEMDDEDDDDESGPSRKSKKKSTDNFFDEDDMMAFIEEGEREMSAGRTLLNKERRPETFDDDMDAEDDEDEDDLDVDIYGDLESDDEVENTGYSDFFDGGKRKRRQEEDGDEDDEDEEFNEGEGFGNADEMDDDDEDDDEDDNGAGAESEDDMTEDFMSRRSRKDILAVHEEEESESAGMTRHELASRKAQQMMREMENENLEARPWLLGGEAGSRSRPENSLLEEDVDFDHARKEVPLVTEEVTKSLEDIIKRRIKDALWDDVERRVPTNADVEFKPRFELNDEKSKQSLSEVYERAYLEQTNQLKEDSPADKARQRLRGLVSALFVRLDALSNAHFVPKKPQIEVQVVSNVPALVAEEITPAASAGTTTRLAPEEIYDKPSRQLVGASELSQEEKKRLRASAKAARKRDRERTKKDEERVAKSNVGLGNKYSKEKALSELKQGALASRVTVADSSKPADTMRYTSSSAVFAKIQESARQPEAPRKKARVVDATRLKL